jgi:hypothetical protein
MKSKERNAGGNNAEASGEKGKSWSGEADFD